MTLSTKVDFIKDRFDPFDEVFSPASIDDEQHTIPAASPFYVRTKEVVKQDAPSSIEIWTGAGKTGTEFTEVSGTPGANQFQVDYKFQSGYIRFNEANANQIIYISYKGLGDVIQAVHINTVQNVLNLDNVPTTIANLLINHNKAIHDALAILHSSLTGLANDEHSQYLNNARHDITTRHPVGVLKFATGSFSESLATTSGTEHLWGIGPNIKVGTAFATNPYGHIIQTAISDVSSIITLYAAMYGAAGTGFAAQQYKMVLVSSTALTRTVYTQWFYHSASKQAIWGIWDKEQKKLIAVLVEEDEGYCKLYPELKPNQKLVKFKNPEKFLKEDTEEKKAKIRKKSMAGYILEHAQITENDIEEIKEK